MPRPAVLALLAIFLLPHDGGAQDGFVDRPGFFLGFNMLVGGGAALVHALADDGDPRLATAFAKGALGGAIMYGGQRLVGTGRPALRLPGVQTVALGASMTRNAGAGAPLLAELTFPLFAAYLRVRPYDARPLSLRLSGVGLAALGWAVASSETFDAELDWKESLLTGAPVFRSAASWIYPTSDMPAPACAHGDRCVGGASGVHRMGMIWYTTGGRSPELSRHTLTHESIHLTQIVRDAVLFGIPTGDAAMQRAGGIFAHIGRFVAIDAFLPLTATNHALAFALPMDRGGKPWRLYELEARALAGTYSPVR
jgi:hypothetical protein